MRRACDQARPALPRVDPAAKPDGDDDEGIQTVLKRCFVVGLVAVSSLTTLAIASALTTATSLPPTKMVPFPSKSVGVVAANLSRREIQRSDTVKVAVIDERPQLIQIRGSLEVGRRTYRLPSGGGATPSGSAVFKLRVPKTDLGLLSGCERIVVVVAGYEHKPLRMIASDRAALVADQPRCAKVPSSPSPLRPTVGQAGVDAPLNMEIEKRSQQSADLRSAVKLGAKWIRIAVEWKFIQQDGHKSFNWSALDGVIESAARLHLYTLGQIESAPSWARPRHASYPRDPVQFATFAAEAAARYAPYGVRAWEIWNEPNYAQFWSPSVDPAAYARLLRITAVAIHAVEPSSTVVSGGLARADCDGTSLQSNVFMSQMLAYGGIGATNAVGVDPYTYPDYPDTSESQGAPCSMAVKNSYAEITEPKDGILALLREHGDSDKPIWVTEFGAPDHGTTGGADVGVGLEGQAQQVSAIFCAIRSTRWGGPVFWYDLRNDGATGDNAVDFFGLLNHNRSPKPAAAVFTKAAKHELSCPG